MSSSFDRRVSFAATPDDLFAVLTSHEFLIARHRQQGALAVRPHDDVRDKDRLVQRVELEEPVFTLMGADRSKTATAVMTYEWDLAARRCRWSYRGSHGERVRISGDFTIEPTQHGADLVSHFHVEVTYPLIGRLAEKRILASIRENFTAFDRLIQERLQRNIPGPG